MSKDVSSQDKVRDVVRKAYGTIAKEQSSCCGSGKSCSCSAGKSTDAVPEAELGLSCGLPLMFTELKPGEVVLDLGSGPGKDVFAAAKTVGPRGRVIGVDMTPEMLELAGQNAAKFRERTGLSNVEFRQGQIERLPVESNSVDLIISNCVINLSPDKPAVFRDAFRVLKSGGRMVVSDIVLNKPLPEQVRTDPDAYSACISGAVSRKEYLDAIGNAGFTKVQVADDHSYEAKGACADPVTSSIAHLLEGVAASVTVVAWKV